MFFKYENGLLMSGNHVESSEFTLIDSLKETYDYPVQGWWWFPSEDYARAFFNVPDELHQ
jgi:hypothetical protein